MRAEHPDTLTETDHPFMTGIALGAWDEGSIMNYCNPQRNGNLSELDVIGVRAIYNHPSVMAGESVSNDEICSQFGKEWEEYQK